MTACPKLLTPDICVIGAGSAGLTVAAAAAQFGVPVVLVEKGEMGGECLNTGCVPSKALIAAAAVRQTGRRGPAFGIEATEPAVDYAGVHRHIHEVIAKIAPHDSVERFEGLGVTVLRDHARFRDARTLEVGDTLVRPRRFVIATGSTAAVPPVEGLETVPYLTNETVFGLTELPGHLLVVGGGPVGVELAQAYRRLGSEVTVIETGSILSRDDPELVEVAREALSADGVRLLENTTLAEVGGSAGAIETVVEMASGRRTIAGTHILVATGRAPTVEGLDLDKAGIAYSAKGISVNRGLRTTNRRAYAIGDCVGGLQFTHVAGYHASLAIRSILFRLPVKVDTTRLPRVTYLDPELGQIGLTEAQAREIHGDRVRVLSAPFSGNDRARAERRTEGLVKIVTGPRGRILGVGMVGAGAGELLAGWSLALSAGVKISTVASHVAPYPTLSEVNKAAAIGYFSESLTNPWLRRILGVLRRLG
ncbi:dihydrolipoyl dehydrogenase family protein [Amorphus orientalis]|uniref:Pyruvate/2-oxoglutarate dehydrogenase complex dihydrolipoamide dehydrogenase (E3) component n=1 Tax=Amorphus orientalis TaxID=649198 RepID=A0AAE4AU04_9HYPH|nr:FAD-dependent oxidoreductase [Amorphus orientalis]MDQ0316662.1 pyruvate/2-oxoglutarate dehydrogenase complex dihydrolipoamide dehydrogenase (E3) component [Amorphus orientalis]